MNVSDGAGAPDTRPHNTTPQLGRGVSGADPTPRCDVCGYTSGGIMEGFKCPFQTCQGTITRPAAGSVRESAFKALTDSGLSQDDASDLLDLAQEAGRRMAAKEDDDGKR